MAEIVAIAGLAYLGKILSEPKKEETYTEVSKQAETVPVDPPSVPIDESMLRMPDKKMEVANFGVVAPQSRSNGSEILSMRNRMYDAGRMNNLSQWRSNWSVRVSVWVRIPQRSVDTSSFFVSTLKTLAPIALRRFRVGVVPRWILTVDAVASLVKSRIIDPKRPLSFPRGDRRVSVGRRG